MKFKKRRVKRERTLIASSNNTESFSVSNLSDSTVRPSKKQKMAAEAKEKEVEVVQASEVEDADDDQEGEPVDEA